MDGAKLVVSYRPRRRPNSSSIFRLWPITVTCDVHPTLVSLTAVPPTHPRSLVQGLLMQLSLSWPTPASCNVSRAYTCSSEIRLGVEAFSHDLQPAAFKGCLLTVQLASQSQHQQGFRLCSGKEVGEISCISRWPQIETPGIDNDRPSSPVDLGTGEMSSR